VAVVLACLAEVSPAGALDAVAPQHGARVGSQPEFAFDFARGNVELEFSRSPDVTTAGQDPGAFVERDSGEDFIIGGPLASGPPFRYGPGRLSAGVHYWHVKADDYADDDDGNGQPGPRPTWGPIRTMVVADEPVIFEGWSVRMRRLKARGRCRGRARVSGTIAWSDNSDRPTARYSIRLSVGSRTLARIRGRFGQFERTFSGDICTRGRLPARVVASAALRDTGGHLAASPRRPVVAR
jgi:hypothetical protein